MIIKDKVSIMSKMSMFEESREGMSALKTVRFFRTDFIRWELLKTAASVTTGYLIIAALAIMYNLEYIIKNATKLNYVDIGFKMLGAYIVVLIIYGVLTFFLAVYKYEKGRKKFAVYKRLFSKLERFYDDEAEEGSK